MLANARSHIFLQSDKRTAIGAYSGSLRTLPSPNLALLTYVQRSCSMGRFSAGPRRRDGKVISRAHDV